MPAAGKKPKPAIHAVDDEQDTKPAPEVDVVESVLIPFRGHQFTIPKLMDEWLTDACLAMSTGDYVLAAKLLLGSRQWTLLQSLGDKRKDIQQFLLVFAEVVSEQCDN